MNPATDISCAEKLVALSCAVVIPTYNNAGTLARVVEEVKRYAHDILVVDDGSTDDTRQILAAIDGIRTISYSRNRGKGYALQIGLREATRLGFRYAITIDSDGQHFPEEIPVFVEEIRRTPDALLIGARNLTADNMPRKNSFANRFSNFWFFVETGRRLEDTQSGFRLYPLRKIAGMRLFTARYEFELEVIVRAVWRDIPVRNIPVKVYYPPRQERVSHFRPWRDFGRISLLNSVLVLVALVYWHPWRFLRQLTWKNVKRFVRNYITHSSDSNLRLSLSIAWGVFWGIVPVWGYQMVLAVATAHLLRLNKVVALVSSNISIPPMIPLILYGSYVTGGVVLGRPLTLRLSEMTLERLGGDLLQYIVGGCVFGIVCAVIVGVVGYLLMSIFKRVPAHE